jgi:hypothetical protein
MIRIGFLSRVRPILWRENFKSFIKDTKEWQFSPFHFRLYHSSLSCNCKVLMAPVLMVDIDCNSIDAGVNFFRSYYDGERAFSPCSIPYLFSPLYKNQLTDEEHSDIIHDALHHKGQVSLVHILRIKDLDVTIHLRQNVAVKLRSLLIRLQTNTPPICKMFQQIEWEADTTSLAYVCTDTCAGTYFYWVFSFQSHPLGFSKSIPQSPA